MNLTTQDVKHIADLSRLKIVDDELENYRENLVSILGYVDKLGEIDTKGVAELAIGSEEINVWRADEAGLCDPAERDSIIKSFPRRQGSLLEVPAVFDGRTE